VVRAAPRAGTLAVGGAVAVTLAAWARGPLPLRGVYVRGALPPAYAYLVRCGDGDPLLELPAAIVLDSYRDAPRMLYSTFHWLPLLNGRTGYPPPGAARLGELFFREPAAAAVADLRRTTGVRWVLAHCGATDRVVPFVGALCAGRAWNDVPARRFDDGARLYDLGRVDVLPRPVPRPTTLTPGCALGG
jgi:hypothetical protein